MANRVEIEFLIKTENEKIRALEADMRGLTRTVQKTSVENGRLTKEQREVAASAKHAAAEAKAQSRQRLADLQAEINMQKRSKMANLGVGLSIMFAGQAIKRFADTALRSLINIYTEVGGRTSTFNLMTNRLAASWAYLKWSIMSALEQTGVMSTVVGLLQSMVNWFNELGPTAKSAIGTLLIGMFLLGTIMGPLGQVITAMSADWAMMGKNALWLAKAVGWVALIFVASKALLDIWTSEGEFFSKVLSSVGVALFAAGVGALLLGSALALPLLLLGGAIMLAMMFKEELGMAFSYLIDGLVVIGNMIVKMILAPLEAAIWLFNKISGALGGKTIKFTPFQMVDAATVAVGDFNKGRREQLQQERLDRGSPLNNVGLGFLSGSGGGGSEKAGPVTNINIQNAYVDQTSAAMSNATSSFNQALAGTPFGG